MNLKKWRDLFEWPVMIFLIVGIVTAALDVEIAGFTPVIWLLISFWFLFIIICMEVSMIRQFLEKSKES